MSGSTTPRAPLRRLSTSLRALQSASIWLIIQQTVAAVLAWMTATIVVGHEEPFFAPMAAVIGMNATLGERGLNAVRMLLGVVVGIAVGELTIALLGRGYGRLAIATFTAMALARVMNANRIVIAQAAASAILTVAALAGARVGFNRLVDAFIGGGIALVFTQVLFSPEPVRLLRRAEAAGLAAVGEILDMTAQALERDDAALAEQTLGRMQDVRNQLIEVERTRRASSRVHRHTVTWRPRARGAALEQEATRARRLDLLGGSCLMLARMSLATSREDRRVVAPRIREMAHAIGELATKPGERDARQRTATRVVELIRTFHGQHPQSALATSTMLLGIVALDFLTFVGVPRDDAMAAMNQTSGELDVSTSVR